jgi:putative heme-binding domain-containing protein
MNRLLRNVKKDEIGSAMRFGCLLIVSGLVLLLQSNDSLADRSVATSIGPGAIEPNSPQEWYGAGVRPSDKRSPEEERLGFHLPPGFEIDLVASEPAIAKPLNMAFDSRHRLWITQTVEYPYPSTNDTTARDCVKTLEDTDGDGTYDRVTTFADGLNIPMGILPIGDGAIVFSIPNLLHLRDTDGDGVCDQRDVILGPFDTTRDTHGMVNALRRGDDGWIYACHGFNNQSTVAGRDGHKISMTSGNTFRFRPDGSRVEMVSKGQVNPFGMTVDRWGNRFSADCHSKPITCLVRNACYPSFGKPHDGLGFFPSMMDHLHGSTAISGLSLYDASGFPEQYRNQLYSGNVMTSRINRDFVKRSGTTYEATEVGDFLTSDDPWFRPVDIQLGPDGALYVADFYNRIIGHYEVPLEHPGRDRDSGRIWKIRYQSPNTSSSAIGLGSGSVGSDATVESLFNELGSSNITRRQLALDGLTDRFAGKLSDGKSAELDSLSRLAKNGLQAPSELLRTNSMWLLNRLNRLTASQIVGLLGDREPLVRQHALRRLVETDDLINGGCLVAAIPVVRGLLDDSEPMVVGTAAQVLGVHGNVADATLILERIKLVPDHDSMLLARLRIALRDLMIREQDSLQLLQNNKLSTDDKRLYRDILLGIKTSEASQAILRDLEISKEPIVDLIPWIDHAARYASDIALSELVKMVRDRTADSSADRNVMFAKLKESTAGRDNRELSEWAESVAASSIADIQAYLDSDSIPTLWTAEPMWKPEPRVASDGQEGSYVSSLPLGEKHTGVLRSGDFLAPKTISFWLVGHNGLPSVDDSQLNRARIVDSVTRQVLIEAFPPRSDIAKKVEWDMAQWAGRSVAFELVDADAGTSYAWVGIGSFEPTWMNPNSSFNDQWASTLGLISQYRLSTQAPALLRFATIEKLDQKRRLQAAAMFSDQSGETSLKIVAELLQGFSSQKTLNSQFLTVFSEHATQVSTSAADLRSQLQTILHGLCTSLARRDQLKVSLSLASNKELSSWLIEAMEEGWLAADLLKEKSIATALDSTIDEAYRPRLTTLQQSIATNKDDLGELRSVIMSKITSHPGDLPNGALLFQKHCAICHQLGGQGSLVGPQLDGIGARGPERLVEDILLPDRNVDKAFRTTSFLLDNGTVQTGLIRTQNETFIELIDITGQVRRIEASEIESQRASGKSLMPDGQQTTLGTDGMVDLLAYLQSAAASKKTP